jgi:crossover junction endodeoxyribonuclease RuvC
LRLRTRHPGRGAESLGVIVIGVDPGTAATGYGVVARHDGRVLALDGGVVETPAAQSLERRLATIHARLSELLDEHRPQVLAIEQLYFGANVKTAFAVGHARGVALLAAGQRGIDCESYTPQQVKSAVCGSGTAPKEQVQRMVATLLSLPGPPSSDHAADALAVAICHLNRAPLIAAIG